MKKLLFILFLLSRYCFADPANLYTAGLQNNPANNAIMADTNTINCRGANGCNYIVGVILHSSNARTFALVTYDSGVNEVFRMTFSVQAGDTKIFTLPSAFFIPNTYRIRILNTTGQLLGSTSQGSISLEVKEIN